MEERTLKMAIVDFALEHARQGRLVFPGIPNTKIPAILNPYEDATTDEAKIISWWLADPNFNICLPGGYEIGPGKYIGFIDVDCKREDKNGFRSMEELDILGCEFPETLAQKTPTGGLHLFYYFDFPIQNSAGLLGKGIDTRGFHGYVLAAGSKIDGKGYVFKNQLQIAPAPEWLVNRLQRRGNRSGDQGAETLGRDRRPGVGRLSVVHSVDQETAERRATEHLKHKETAREGERNPRGFETACRIKDFGLTRERTFSLMSTDWKCEPALETDELWAVVNSAFKYGQNEPGILSPEMAFDPIPITKTTEKPRHPIDLNHEYAYVTAGGGSQILWFTTDADGKPFVDHLSVKTFHEKNANRFYFPDGGKKTFISKAWMEWPERKTYRGVVFQPNKEYPDFFNKWRGFLCEPLKEAPTEKAIQALERFKDHIIKNVARGEKEHADWIFAWLAHVFQKPEEKPRTALVLRGKKGVGKSVIFDCLSRIIGSHYLSVANRRYLSGNFNAHLEDKIMYVLEEAFWSGEKGVEGILKDLVTGKTHMIERKGREAYPVQNLARVVILGNDEWIVPASEDERRYAVFDVAEHNKDDAGYFKSIAEEMDHRLLLKFFMEFDLTKVDINKLPKTAALMAQKEQSLDPFKAWWLSCLKAGEVSGSSTEGWPEEISRDQFRHAFLSEIDAQKIKGRLPNSTHIGRLFSQIAASSRTDKMKREGERRYRVYSIAPLDVARKDWERFIDGPVEWNKI
jgi:hypothetical protein